MSKSSPFGPFAGPGAVMVTCRECDHEWMYTGQTPYAQCRCGASNNLNGEDVDYRVLSGESDRRGGR